MPADLLSSPAGRIAALRFLAWLTVVSRRLDDNDSPSGMRGVPRHTFLQGTHGAEMSSIAHFKSEGVRLHECSPDH
jgi:hypothetical protein